jgi:hypothetical protein
MGLGENAAAGVGNAGMSAASAAGKYETTGANAQSQGILGSANAWNNTLQSGVNTITDTSKQYQNQLLQQQLVNQMSKNYGTTNSFVGGTYGYPSSSGVTSTMPNNAAWNVGGGW